VKKRILMTGLFILLAAGAYLGYHWYQNKNKAPETPPPLATVKKGEFVIAIHDTGVFKAKKSVSILVPTMERYWGGFKITKLVPEGSRVKEKDPIFWFDMTELEQQAKAAEYNLKNEESQLKSALESLRLQRENRSKLMREKKLDWDSAKLEYELEKKKFDKIQRLVVEEILPQNDFDEEQRKFRQATLKVDQTEKEYLKAAEQQASEERTKEIDIERYTNRSSWQKREYDQLTTSLAQSIVYSPTDGILILAKNWRNRVMSTLKEGDMVWPGNSLGFVPDLSQMQVMTQVNESDLSKVSTGMNVRVRVDAIPDLLMTGKVGLVGTLAKEREESEGSGQVSTEESAGIKVFEITIDMDTTDNRLRPGMTCKTELILEVVPDAISIPMRAINNEDGKYFVKVYTPGKPSEKRQITLGKRNAKDVVVTKGLKPGDEVVLPETE